MDAYQAIYDAACSRIGRVNSAEAVEVAAREAFDMGHARAILQEQIAAVGFEMVRPSVVFRPSLYPDGDMWCALYGEDLQSGCAGFGETPNAAMADFDKNWHGMKAGPQS